MPTCEVAPRLRGDSGAGLIEFAVMMPFLAIFIFGTVDIGRAFVLRNRLTNMSREGAFYAQYYNHRVSGCSPTSITDVAKMEDVGVKNATVTVTNSAGAAVINDCTSVNNPGVRIKVKVSAPMTVFTPFVGVASGNTIMVSGETEIVVQGL